MKTEGGVTEEKWLWWKLWFNFKGRFCIYFKLNTADSSKSLHVNKSIILSKYFNHDFPHTGNDVWSSERNRSQQAETETAALKFKWCQSLKGKGVEPMLTEWKGDTWVSVCPRVSDCACVWECEHACESTVSQTPAGKPFHLLSPGGRSPLINLWIEFHFLLPTLSVWGSLSVRRLSFPVRTSW